MYYIFYFASEAAQNLMSIMTIQLKIKTQTETSVVYAGLM